MSSAAIKRELGKVKLEARKAPSKEEPDSASDTESDVTELGDGPIPDYYPDAIKWAWYRDSHEDRPKDGFEGWHYGVMWTGYLKSWSDTEEPYGCFELDDNGRNQMMEDFWNAQGRPLRDNPDGEGRLEPEGKLDEVLTPPNSLAKRWINAARPRRSFKLFLIRQKKEAEGEKIEKRDSDYYWLRNLRRQQQAKRAAEQRAAVTAKGKSKSASQQPTASSSSQRPPTSSSSTQVARKIKSKSVISTTTDTNSDSDDEEARKKAKERKEKAAAAKLGDLFEESPKKNGRGKGKEKDPLFSEDEEENDKTTAIAAPAPSTSEPAPPPKLEDKKRKAETTIPSSSPKGSRGPSPPKKAKSPEKQPAPPTPAASTSTPAAPSTQPAASPASAATATPAPAAQQEPLFLESAPSPHDTFGTPLPGIFDAPSPASQPTPSAAADRQPKATIAEPVKDTLKAPVATITVTAPTPTFSIAGVKGPQNAQRSSSPSRTTVISTPGKNTPPPVTTEPACVPEPIAHQPEPVTSAPLIADKSSTPLEPGEVDETAAAPASKTTSPANAAPAPVVRVPTPSPPIPLSPLQSPRAQPPTLSPPPPPQSISPPRYGTSKSPERPASPSKSKSISPTTVTSPIKPNIPLSERPKYVQPSRIQIMQAIVDPEAEARRQKMAARKASHPAPTHPSLPVRPHNIVPPTGSYQSKGPNTAPPRALQSPFSVHNRPPPPAGPSSAPLQNNNWPSHQPPTGPAATMQGRPSGNYGGYGGGPLPDQKAAYQQVAPWKQRKQSGGHGGGHGNLSPVAPVGNATPMWGGASPIAPTSAVVKNLSPNWSPNAPAAPSSFTQPMRSPMYGGATPQAVDPRSASASNNASPVVGQQPLAPAPAAVDPRRPGAAPAVPRTPLLDVPGSPNDRSSASGTRRVDRLGRLAIRVDSQMNRHHLVAVQGAFSGQQADGDAMVAQILQSTSTDKPSLNFDSVDLSLLQWQVKHGARVVQWVKLGFDGEQGALPRWLELKTKSAMQRQTWITYTEHLLAGNTITDHYALVVTAATNVETTLLGPGLGLGPWTSIKEAGLVLLVVALPLDSAMPPPLPNPVQPDKHFEGKEDKFDMPMDELHVMASYGLSPEFFVSLSGQRSIVYPPTESDQDILEHWIKHELSDKGALPVADDFRPEVAIFINNKIGRAVQSSTLRSTANRRTRFYAVGPSLHLSPAQWTLTEIWKTGGLVTFSPTFILRSPDKFAEIMKTIRMAPNWAAYVIPDVVQWVEASWQIPARCPKPSKAFQTFTKSLFLDHHVLQLSGSKASSGGGLAVSTCPPTYAQTDKCGRWMEWLARASNQTEYKALVDLCFDYARCIDGKRRSSMDMDVDVAARDLDLIDIETKQMEDLTAMRMRPHLLPYRRYIHIGEVSLPSEKRDRLARGFECVDPDSFAAILSGAV